MYALEHVDSRTDLVQAQRSGQASDARPYHHDPRFVPVHAQENLVDRDSDGALTTLSCRNREEIVHPEEVGRRSREPDVRAEVVLRGVDLWTVRQSLRHGGTGLANASRADFDRLAVVGEEQVVGVDLDDAVGPHDLPIHAPQK